MPSLTTHNGSGYVPAKRVELNVNGSWASAKRVEQNIDGVWTVVWNARTVSITILKYETIRVRGPTSNTYTDRLTFGVSVSDSATPSSYQWSGAADGQASTVTFTGTAYQDDGFSQQVTGDIAVEVVVEGLTYSATRTFQYTVGDAV